MKLDPAELRRRNMVRPEQMPYKNAMGMTYDSGKFEQILNRGLVLSDWNGYAARREASKKAGKLRGRGIATFLAVDQRQRVRGEGLGQHSRDGIIEHRLGHAGHGPGHLPPATRNWRWTPRENGEPTAGEPGARDGKPRDGTAAPDDESSREPFASASPCASALLAAVELMCSVARRPGPRR